MSWREFFEKVRSMNTPIQTTPMIKHGVVMVSPPKNEEFVNVEPLDLTKVRFVKSPNRSVRKGNIKYIGIHHTGPGSYNGIIKWLCNSQAKASAHYVVSTSGQITQLVDYDKYEAWHFGVASWKGKKINNHGSIGIEIQNPGLLQKGADGCYYYEQGRNLKKYTGKVTPISASITYPDGRELAGYAVPYPEEQISKVIALCKALVKKYPQITAEDILAHYEVSQYRKNDPFGLDIDEMVTRIFSK